MYKTCHSEQSSLRQQEIAEVFLRLLLETPMEQLRISALCQEAGISRKVFYRYFDTKEDVLRFLADRLCAEFWLCLPTFLPLHTVPRLEDCAALFRFWGQRQALLVLLLDGRYNAPFRDALQQQFRAEHPSLAARAESDWRYAATAVYLFHGFLGLLRFWAAEDFRETPEELGALLLSLLDPPPAAAPADASEA